jgi:large subunit ribosomal protein L25
MEKTLQLKAEIRQQTGSKATSRLRKQGLIPAIVYGHKQAPTAVSLNAHDFVEGLHHGHRLMDVKIDKKPQTVIVKDVQYDYMGKEIIHADLMRVDITETVTVTVPLEFKGKALGAEGGGIIQGHLNHLEVACKVTDIPESIVVSVKDMNIGDSLHVRDIQIPEGLKLISDPERLVVSCILVIEVKTTEQIEEEAPPAPEVIGEAERAKKQEESPQEKSQ